MLFCAYLLLPTIITSPLNARLMSRFARHRAGRRQTPIINRHPPTTFHFIPAILTDEIASLALSTAAIVYSS